MRERRASFVLVLIASSFVGCGGTAFSIDAGADAASSVDGGPADADANVRDASPALDAAAPLDAALDAGPSDAAAAISYVALEIPDGGAIGADDIVYGHRIGRVILPTGQSLQLYDPTSSALVVIGGFGVSATFDAGAPHGVAGTTSADDGPGVVFAIDRRSQLVAVVDPVSRAIVSTAPLAAQPDILRYAAATQEIWVTEPSAIQIEVFSTSAGAPPVHSALVSTPIGCEALAIDDANGRAYTNSGANTLGIDLVSHAVVTTWPHGCVRAHGIALDPRGLVVIDCNEGHLQVLDALHDGAQLSYLAIPAGTDLIDYDPTLGHLYVASSDGTLSVVSLDAAGTLALVGTLAEGTTARAAAVDPAGNVYLIDAVTGRLVVVTDPYPSSL